MKVCVGVLVCCCVIVVCECVVLYGCILCGDIDGLFVKCVCCEYEVGV